MPRRTRTTKVDSRCSICGSRNHWALDCPCVPIEGARGSFERAPANGEYHGSAPVRIIEPGLTGMDLRRPAPVGEMPFTLEPGVVIERRDTLRRYRVLRVGEEKCQVAPLAARFVLAIWQPRWALNARHYRRVA